MYTILAESVENPYIYFKLLDIKKKTYRERGSWRRSSKKGNLRIHIKKYGPYF